MAWRYRVYRFADQAAFLAACEGLGWPVIEGAPQPPASASLAITGDLPRPGAEGEEAAVPPGWYLMAAWQGEPPAAWEEMRIAEPVPGMTVFAGWNEPTPIGPVVSKTELMDLLTEPEQLAYVTSPDPTVAWWRYRASLQDGGIDLRNPRLAEALAALVAGGVLTEARAGRILAGLPPE